MTTGNRYIDRLMAGDHGERSEKRVAKRLGADLQPASGALKGAKSDSRIRRNVKFRFRIESKSTVNMAMAVQLEWLVKISHEAMASGDIPLLTMSFVDGTGRPRSGMNTEWVAMPRTFFEELREIVEAKE